LSVWPGAAEHTSKATVIVSRHRSLNARTPDLARQWSCKAMEELVLSAEGFIPDLQQLGILPQSSPI
jgi:hypothetical protein